MNNKPYSPTPNSWPDIELSFRLLTEELLFQIESTWGAALQPEDVRLTWPNRDGRNMTMPNDMFVREVLDIHRPEWHREHDLGPRFLPRAFTDRDQPYVLRTDCRSNRPAPPADP